MLRAAGALADRLHPGDAAAAVAAPAARSSANAPRIGREVLGFITSPLMIFRSRRPRDRREGHWRTAPRLIPGRSRRPARSRRGRRSGPDPEPLGQTGRRKDEAPRQARRAARRLRSSRSRDRPRLSGSDSSSGPEAAAKCCGGPPSYRPLGREMRQIDREASIRSDDPRGREPVPSGHAILRSRRPSAATKAPAATATAPTPPSQPFRPATAVEELRGLIRPAGRLSRRIHRGTRLVPAAPATRACSTAWICRRS